MKHIRRCLSLVMVMVLMLSMSSAVVFAQETAIDLGPVTSKDVIYQIITDRFYDGDTSNNVPSGFDLTYMTEQGLT